MTNFFLAETDDEYTIAGSLFKAYAASIKINLDFQHFDDELAGLKKMYAKPFGGIILARQEHEIIGCVAIRKISEDTAELKRMFVKPAYQQMGIGKFLLVEALQLARDCNYALVKLDTLNYMHPAIHLYKQAGFYETAPYYYNPITTAIYFEIKL